MVSDEVIASAPRLVARQECSRSPAPSHRLKLKRGIARLALYVGRGIVASKKNHPWWISGRVFKTMHQSLTLQTPFESGLPTVFARLALLRLPL